MKKCLDCTTLLLDQTFVVIDCSRLFLLLVGQKSEMGKLDK
jgi:hypothetical protein